MAFEKEILYLNQNKQNIILLWFELLEEQYPHNYSFDDFEERANILFQFLTEFEIPAEIHPHLDAFFIWDEQPQELVNTMEHLFHRAQSWRDAFLNVLLNYEDSKSALECFGILSSRQNVYVRQLTGKYVRDLGVILEGKDRKVNNLHDDRLNLIGKMAASMAHEIRNPLTSISGFLKLIRENIVNDSQMKLLRYIDVIEDEFDAINMQITGFLSFSKNKILEENFADVSVLQLINSTLFLLNPRITSDNIHLAFNDKENCNSTIYVQKVSMQQVLSNIISNAVDALMTVKCQKEITIICNEDPENTYIHIKNNGLEIAREIRDSLFEPFMTNKENGTGLGLAICREIMTKNNGKIEFYSNSEETSFKLSFSKQMVLF